MKNNSYSNLIWSSIIKSWGPIITFLSFGLAFASYFFVPAQDTISLKLFFVIFCIGFLFLAVFAKASWEALQNQIVSLPKVIYAKDPPKAFPNGFALFLIEPSSLFSYGGIVSIYYLEDGVERLVGVGKVINVQNDLKVQVLVLEDYDFRDKAESIKSNSKDELSKLIVKPSIPDFLYGGF